MSLFLLAGITASAQMTEDQIIKYVQEQQAKGVSQYQLLKAGVDNRTLDSLKKGRNITMVTLARLCRILDCTPNEIVEIRKE